MKHYSSFIKRSIFFKISDQKSTSISPSYTHFFISLNQSDSLVQQITTILNNSNDYISTLQKMHFERQINEMNINKLSNGLNELNKYIYSSKFLNGENQIFKIGKLKPLIIFGRLLFWLQKLLHLAKEPLMKLHNYTKL